MKGSKGYTVKSPLYASQLSRWRRGMRQTRSGWTGVMETCWRQDSDKLEVWLGAGTDGLRDVRAGSGAEESEGELPGIIEQTRMRSI